MKNYEFIKDYKCDTNLRLSFNALAKETFGLDFEPWYEQGFWNDNYICYSYLENNQVISNVSLNTMEVIMNGQIQKAIQIGTVMTHPLYRRQGLAQDLMKKIFKDYDQTYEMYFLAADDVAVPLYKKCGFMPNRENKYVIDVTEYPKIKEALKPIALSSEKLIEVKKQSQPLSNVLSVQGDEHVLMFYYTLGFSGAIYQPLPNIYTIYEIEDKQLHLYDILSPEKVNLQELLHRIIPEDVQTIFCHFTPDQPIRNLKVSIDETSNWMIRTTSNKAFPNLARFPRISQT